VKAALASWARQAVTPSAFKVGLLVTALACGLLLVPAPRLHELLDSLDCRVHDLMFRVRGRQPDTGRVVVVDIDEASLGALGQWPWPRDVMAQLVGRIAAQKPQVVGFDIVFAEPDRTALRLAAEQLSKLTGTPISLPPGTEDHDEAFARALGEAQTVLGYYFELLAKEGNATAPVRISDDRLPCPEFSVPVGSAKELVAASEFPRAVQAVLNLSQFNDAVLSEGFFNTVPDEDGVTRGGNLLIRFGDVLYPSLALEMAREGCGSAPDLVGMPGVGITTVKLGDRSVPVTRQGQLCINYRGPPKTTIAYYSAVDVLRGNLPPDALKDKYILLGTSAIGLLDMRSTPFASAFPGVEINATILDNLLAGDPMVYDKGLDLGLTVTFAALFGVMLAAGLAFLGPRVGALCGVLFLLLLGYGNYRLLFLHNQLVGVTYVTASLLLVFLSVSVANFFFEGRRRRFLHSAFSLYVSRDMVDAIVRNPGKLSLEGEEKDLTILFTDIRGFTTISEQMTARQLSAFLNEYLSEMTDIIMARGGTVDKFIGDAIMAFWGAPLDDRDHAAHALSACLAMRRRLAELRPGWVARGLPPIETGIGANSGPVSVGNMGSATRFSYTVMGDAVNLASRLEGLTKIYGAGILVSDRTRRAAGDGFFCRPIDQVRVKGKREPVALFEPLADGPVAPELQQEVARFEAALNLYRSREFERCREELKALQETRPQTLYGLYLERVELFLEQAPPADWDGVFTFNTKGHDEG
jgi:adenylate cyclase